MQMLTKSLHDSFQLKVLAYYKLGCDVKTIGYLKSD